MIDRFYQRSKGIKASDIQLIGVSCFFIMSKIIEIECLNIQVLTEDMFYRKYTSEDFLEKESQILTALDFYVETP